MGRRFAQTTLAKCSDLAPLSILHHPSVAASGLLALAMATVHRVSIREALDGAAELGEQLELDVKFGDGGMTGNDAAFVRGK